MKYKISKEIKSTFVSNILLFVIGLIVGNFTIIGTSIIIFVILSVAIEVLEAVFDLKNPT